MTSILPEHAYTTDREEATEHVMSILDLDNDGFIDFNEFLCGAMNHQTLLSKANIEHMF